MRNKILLGAILSGLLMTGYAFAASDLKNVKVPSNAKMSKADLKKYMKTVASALGVQCDHCHDTDDMSKDTEKKEVARKMMLMVDDLNKKEFKAGRIKCVTCHDGTLKPK